jgi:hypothetical protein
MTHYSRATGCQLADKENNGGDPDSTHLPSTQVPPTCPKGEGVELNIYLRVCPRSIISCLVTIGVVIALTLLTIKWAEHFFRG